VTNNIFTEIVLRHPRAKKWRSGNLGNSEHRTEWDRVRGDRRQPEGPYANDITTCNSWKVVMDSWQARFRFLVCVQQAKLKSGRQRILARII
jgi:hypothetical protein